MIKRKDVRLAKKTLRIIDKKRKEDPDYRMSKAEFNIIRKGGLRIK